MSPDPVSLTNNVGSQGSEQLDLGYRLKVRPPHHGIDTMVDSLLQLSGNTLAHLSHLPAVASNNGEKSRPESNKQLQMDSVGRFAQPGIVWTTKRVLSRKSWKVDVIFQEDKVANLNRNVDTKISEQSHHHLVVLVKGSSQVRDHNLLHPEQLHHSDRKSCFSRSESLIKVSSALEDETLSLAEHSQHQFSLMTRESSEGIVGDLLVIQWWRQRINTESRET